MILLINICELAILLNLKEVKCLADMIVTVASYILPLFAIIVLVRCMRSMLGNKSQTEIW